MQDQFESNYAWFRAALPNFIRQHRGQHALLHNRSVAAYYPSSLEAIKAGMMKFGEGNFSVEIVDDRIEDLGFYSHVDSALRA